MAKEERVRTFRHYLLYTSSHTYWDKWEMGRCCIRLIWPSIYLMWLVQISMALYRTPLHELSMV